LVHLGLHSFPTRRSSDLSIRERSFWALSRKDSRTNSVRSSANLGSEAMDFSRGKIWASSFARRQRNSILGLRKSFINSSAEYDRSEEHTSELQSPYDLVC